MPRLGYHDLSDQVHQAEQLLSRCRVIPEVDLARMDSVVANHTNKVQRLLNTRVQALADERRYVGVQVLACLTELSAELLNREAKQRGGTSRRLIEDRACLLIVRPNSVRQIGVREGRSTLLRPEESVMDPNSDAPANVATSKMKVVYNKVPSF